MGILILVLRVVHIFSGVSWFGMGMFRIVFIGPTLKVTGPEGQRFMQKMSQVTPINRVVGLAGGLTVLSGLILYAISSNGFQGGWITSPYGLSITLGGLFALAVMFRGARTLGPLTQRIMALGRAMAAEGSPKPEQVAEMQALQTKLERGGVQGVILLSLALLFMSIAQALPLLFA